MFIKKIFNSSSIYFHEIKKSCSFVKLYEVYVFSFRKFYDELKSKGLIAELSSDIEGRKPSEPGTIDFVMPKGSSSIVKHFFQQSGLEVQFDHFVENIKLADNKWAVSTKVHFQIR